MFPTLSADSFPLQSDPDFQTPLILGEQLAFSDCEEPLPVNTVPGTLCYNNEPSLSIASCQNPATSTLVDRGLPWYYHDDSFCSRNSPSLYINNNMPSLMAAQKSQVLNCAPYITKNEHTSSYPYAPSSMTVSHTSQFLEIVSYTPQRGGEGSQVVVLVQSRYDRHISTFGAWHLVFGSKKNECFPYFIGFEDNAFLYAVSASTPSFTSTESASYTIPIQIFKEASTDYAPLTLQVGAYTYEHVSQPSTAADLWKRIPNSHFDDLVPTPAKGVRGIVPNEECHHHYPIRDRCATYYLPYIQNVHRKKSLEKPFISEATTETADGISWCGNQSLGHTGHSCTFTRTSTLQQETSLGSHQTQTYSSYASLCSTRAVLSLNGDLNAMTENWTKQERYLQRRLVQFTRSQSMSTVHAYFKAVDFGDRPQNSICISCISWETKNDYYVTSVDIICLLEALVRVHFTVDEKNRIRRNLEEFHPLTVSKAKSDSQKFFKVIMGFPAPRPRNIEKDIKVFPWRILGRALNKVVGKYSASYCFIANALPAPTANFDSRDTGSPSHNEAQAPSPWPVSGHDAAYGHSTTTVAPNYSTFVDELPR